jgi:uncharacterized protein YbbC (DUF1343 family)
MNKVLPAIDTLPTIGKKLLKGRRYGLVAHGASITSHGKLILDFLMELGIDKPRVIFTPEHGLFGEYAYMEPVPSDEKGWRGVPIISLYGSSFESLAPPQDALSNLDCLVFDLQDVGARYYTYLATMAISMEACTRAGVQFVVLDRPNPIGLLDVEGNIPKPHLRSFVSYLDVPNRHGFTSGESARFFAYKRELDIDLLVVECAGLMRPMQFPDTFLPFCPPSPNINDFECALFYPGLCLLEGTNLSEGRGTTTPFKVFGAPFIEDPFAFCARLNEFGLKGIAFKPMFFVPKNDKWAGQRCGGAQAIVLDRRQMKPLLVGLCVLWTALHLYKEAFEWRKEPYEFESRWLACDLLFGDENIKAMMELAKSPFEVYEYMNAEQRGFVEESRDFFIYPDLL